MAVQKHVKVEGVYKHGHGVSQVTEIVFTGGQTRQIGIEQTNKAVTLTIVGSEELEALIKGFQELKVPVYHEDPAIVAAKEKAAKEEEERKAKEYAETRAQRSATLAANREAEREAAKADDQEGQVESSED